MVLPIKSQILFPLSPYYLFLSIDSSESDPEQVRVFRVKYLFRELFSKTEVRVLPPHLSQHVYTQGPSGSDMQGI